MSNRLVVYMGPYLQFAMPEGCGVDEVEDEVTRLWRGLLHVVVGDGGVATLVVGRYADYGRYGVRVIHQDDVGGPGYPMGEGLTLSGDWASVRALEAKFGVMVAECRGVVLQWV